MGTVWCTDRRRARFGRGVLCLGLLGACLLFAAGPARAGVFGYGEKRCLDYIDEATVPEVGRLYVGWAQGYFSAVSYREGLSDFTRGIGNDPGALERWLRRYCERRNSKKFYEAVDAFAEELIKFGAQKTR